jgi:hypothetical protein
MSEWIEHDGKGIPVPANTEVEVRFRDGDPVGTLEPKLAWTWGENSIDSNWVHHPKLPSRDDIVAYRIITTPDSSLTPP